MKKLNYIFIGSLFVLASLIISCNSDDSNSETDSDTTIVQMEQKMDELEAADKDSTKMMDDKSVLGKEYTARYICPDHCKGSGSDKPGECPNCGMELMENPTFEKK